MMHDLEIEYDDYDTIQEAVGWSDKSQSVPDDVRRIWDSEAAELPDDCEDWELSEFLEPLDLLPDLTRETTDEDYRTDTWGEDYRIEEALEGCPFETDNLEKPAGLGMENISDLFEPGARCYDWGDNV